MIIHETSVRNRFDICKISDDRFGNLFVGRQLVHSRSKRQVGLVANKTATQYREGGREGGRGREREERERERDSVVSFE